MAEALVSTPLQLLKNVIYDEVGEELRLLMDAPEEVKKLDTNLKSIKPFLEDAEKKQMMDEGVKLWLDRLKEASYDIEDALDEWRTLILEVQAVADKSAYFLPRKVCHFLQCFCLDHTRHCQIACDIKESNRRLCEIVKEKDMFQFTSKVIKKTNISSENVALARRVLSVTNCTVDHDSERLSQVKCWFRLREIAFSGRDMETFEDLEESGWEITGRWKGLPLAVKIIGSLLQFKRSKQEWENVLNSKLMEIRFGA